MKLPACLGIARYSITLLPDKPSRVNVNLLSILGSYTSKSFGKATSGVLTNFKLPVPEMTNLMVTASFVFSSFVLIDELIVNSPTPPEKLAGLPSGNTFTLMVSLGVTMFFFTST